MAPMRRVRQRLRQEVHPDTGGTERHLRLLRMRDPRVAPRCAHCECRSSATAWEGMGPHVLLRALRQPRHPGRGRIFERL